MSKRPKFIAIHGNTCNSIQHYCKCQINSNNQSKYFK